MYEALYNLYHWTYWDIMCLPIPVFVDTLEALNKRLKAEEKAMKKGNKKHGKK